MTGPSRVADAAPAEVARSSRLEGFASLRWVDRFEWWLLGAVALVGAVARAGGLSGGTLFRDDAWVALTSRVPLGTALRMVVTTPGFVLAERELAALVPHATWAMQLPTLVASVAGIVAVGRLARWWGLSAAASLVAAGVVAVAGAHIEYATHLKPYAFDLLAACLVLWLAERVRRDGAEAAPWLAIASVCVCAFSLTPVPLVVGVWAVLIVRSVATRAPSTRLYLSAGAAALGLLVLWGAVRRGVSPRLRHSWVGNYLVVSSPSGFAHSVRSIVEGFLAGVGDTTPRLGLHGLGQLDRAALVLLAVLGLTAWRRQLMGIAALAAALVLSVPSLVPLGTGRTDSYLYPAVALLVAEGASLAWRLVSRFGRAAAVVALGVAVAFTGLLALDRVSHRATYPGGDLAAVGALATAALDDGKVVVIGGTARWPWTYYRVGHVRISFSTLYNNGYTTRSDDPRVIVIPGSAIEGGYAKSALAAAFKVRGHCPGVLYVESADWPSMPMSLLEAMKSYGELVVTSGPVTRDGYRYWTLVPRLPCPLGASGR